MYSQQYMDELRKLLGFQYYFLSRVFARSGELPSQSLDQNLAEVDQLLAEVFSGTLSDEEREGALASLEIFFEAARSLSEELGEFPRFDDVWDRYEELVFDEAEVEDTEIEDTEIEAAEESEELAS